MGETVVTSNKERMKNGAIGCTMSHIQCLMTVIREEYDYVFICEDDIEILNPSLFTENINKFFFGFLRVRQ